MISVMAYHIPVLLNESIEALQVKPNGTYVDLTFGGGGHSMAILENVKGGKLIAFDQDEDAAENAERLQSKSFKFIKANFRHFDKFLKVEKIKKVDGILADLGVSSHQIDVGHRGFSTRFSGALDMRMDMSKSKSAAQILNTYEVEELQNILSMYGEVRNARTLAHAIVTNRDHKPFRVVDDLKQVLYGLAPRGREYKYFAKVFQALRIEVNDELGALREMLKRSVKALNPGGRIAVISYHSLEDRLVKNFFRKGNFEGIDEKDLYGNVISPLEPVNRKPIMPKEEEIFENNRARSAKLRVAEKLIDHASK
jgi:16S rRNA (cytosine1402-N4)-methyltransferase